VAGVLCDKYEPFNFMTKAYVNAFMGLLAVPLFAVAFLTTSSFALSMSFFALEVFLCEGWLGIAVS